MLWIIVGPGAACALFWGLAGVVLALTVIGLPFAFAAFRIMRFAFLPFGQRLVSAADVGQRRIFGTGLANLVWIVVAGLWLFLFHVIAGILLCLTIIGIPFGFAHFRLAAVSLAPLGQRAVFTDRYGQGAVALR